jgi:hypothetical protein
MVIVQPTTSDSSTPYHGLTKHDFTVWASLGPTFTQAVADITAARDAGTDITVNGITGVPIGGRHDHALAGRQILPCFRFSIICP